MFGKKSESNLTMEFGGDKLRNRVIAGVLDPGLVSEPPIVL
jgi:hypothetical protein